MSVSSPSLDPEFIEKQRRRLDALRDQLLRTAGATRAEDRAYQDEHGSGVEDEADAGDYVTEEYVYQSVQEAEEARLRKIERALQKINEGTYGYSDRSGEPIPRVRLEATPEAGLTVEEERQEEERQEDQA